MAVSSDGSGPPGTALSSSDARAELVACETCGNAQRDALGRAPGEVLIEHLHARRAELGDIPVDVSSVRCLWACKQSCAVHVRGAGRVGYVIANLEATEVSARALLDYATLYANSSDGAVPYKQWPAALKGHFLCRIPLTHPPGPAKPEALAPETPLLQEQPQ
jgi:predicted metal-binding protein